MKNKLKNNKGITLVALVVTIVVLLILAGVSINLVIGENGIISKAKDAKKDYEQSKLNEEKDLQGLNGWMDEQVPPPPIKVAEGTKASKNGTINGGEPTAMNPIIPQGYIPINQGEAVWGDGTNAPTEASVNNGLVIKDESGNEWVWVPVPEPSELYEAKSNTITQGGVNVTTQNYTKSATLPGATRGTPNSTSFREPGIVVGDNTQYDAGKYYSEKTYVEVAGFPASTTLEQFAKALVDDYNDMIASLEKYRGFYIGRYELSEQGEKKGATVGSQIWYTAYKQAKNIIPNEATGKVETRMIWGLQWDATCKWISNNGDKKNINNSSSWGNHATEQEFKSIQVTGFSEEWKANNIYDLAGNCAEWTQEAISTKYRVVRGGDNYNTGSHNSVSNHNEYRDTTQVAATSRCTLYVK